MNSSQSSSQASSDPLQAITHICNVKQSVYQIKYKNSHNKPHSPKSVYVCNCGRPFTFKTPWRGDPLDSQWLLWSCLLAYRLLGWSLRRFECQTGVILACSSGHVLVWDWYRRLHRPAKNPTIATIDSIFNQRVGDSGVSLAVRRIWSWLACIWAAVTSNSPAP